MALFGALPFQIGLGGWFGRRGGNHWLQVGKFRAALLAEAGAVEIGVSA